MAESNDPEVTNKSDPTNVTPQKFSGPEDARKNSKAGKACNNSTMPIMIRSLLVNGRRSSTLCQNVLMTQIPTAQS